MTRPRIYLLNGAPESGKDTAGKALTGMVMSSRIVKFAEPLKAGCAAFFCGGDRELFDSLDLPGIKDQPHDIFEGMTTRQAQIWFSEDIFKPKFGPMIFGKLLAKEIRRRQEHGYVNFFVTDSGFRPEAEYLINQFGAESLYLFRLHREGCNFKIDSRGHINLADKGVPEWDVTNHNGNRDAMINSIYEVVKDAARF